MRYTWVRSLRLGDGPLDDLDFPDSSIDSATGEGIHARSFFRGVADPDRGAVYCVRGVQAGAPRVHDPSHHTLIVVREFRRVPLHASALALMISTARPGCGARVAAVLAEFAERAVSLYQPAYMLLAHSLEQPRICVLMMAVNESAALQAASPAAFSIESLLPEMRPLLVVEPEWYAYCPEPRAETLSSLVSPHAV
ncbi:MAG TPA: hypothetical protein VGL09_02790 [Methylomirabilota bacterium]